MLKETKMRISVLLLLTMMTGVFSCSEKGNQTGSLNVLKINNFSELQQFFKYTGNDIPVISGHRGGMAIGYPENSIPAFENVLKHTPAFFEIDPRLSKDSIIVLMHDATLERTTNGKGKVSDYTLAELKEFRLKDREGTITDFQIPTLEEVVKWGKGKTILNLDKKDVPLIMTAMKLKEWDTEASVMVTVHNAEQAKFYYDQLDNIMFSAFIKTEEALKEYERMGIPWTHMIAYVGPTNKPENKKLYDLLHDRGVMCMISSASTYDKEEGFDDRKISYFDIIKDGADILESDLPIEVAAAIKPLMPSESPKARFYSK